MGEFHLANIRKGVRMLRDMLRTLPLAAFLLTSACHSTPTLSDAIGEYSLRELAPPTTLVPPGTIVYSKDGGFGDQDGKYRIGILCTVETALGSEFRPQISETKTTEISEKVTRELTLGADFLKAIQSRGEFSQVKTINLNLSNVEVQEVVIEQVISKTRQRTSSCQEAIEVMRRDSVPVAMIVTALKGDVVYTVQLDEAASLSASDRARILGGLAEALGVERERAATTTISGTGLFWGVYSNDSFALRRADGSLVAAFRPADAPQSPQFEFNILPEGAAVVLDVEDPPCPECLSLDTEN